MSVSDCKLIQLPIITDDRGRLTFLESCRHVPFEIKRIYYLYDIPNAKTRGAHGHRELRQMIFAIAGSFKILLDDGKSQSIYVLNKPSEALYLTNMIWREISDFSDDAVCMVVASDYYKEEDYFRNYEEFVDAVRR